MLRGVKAYKRGAGSRDWSNVIDNRSKSGGVLDLLAWPVICATACCTICHFGIANIAPVSSQKEKIKKVVANHVKFATTGTPLQSRYF